MDIKLKDFEGPLDLLLHLVSKYQVDIYEVPITEVIEQYLAYIKTLQAMRLEVAGEYMLMASQLMLIKSRKLLPKIEEADSELEDPEEDLLQQLEEYQKFKLLSQQLGLQHDKRAQYFSKPKLELIYDDIELNRDKSEIDIFLAFSQVMAAKQEAFKNSHTTVVAEEYRIEDMILRLKEEFKERHQISLQDIFQSCQSLDELITMFLATLELMKTQVLIAKQDGHFSHIYLRKVSHESIS